MASSKSINKFTQGLNVSNDEINQPKDSYSYALNAVKEDSLNNPELLSNELGFSLYKDFGYNYILLGSQYLGKKDYVFFIKNVEGESPFNRIIFLNNQDYSVVYDDLNLNFNDSNTIKSTYRINYKNERIVYFVDGVNDDRVINIDSGITINDISQLNIDLKYIPAVLTSRQVNDTGGGLLTGALEFFGSYKSIDNATTGWFMLNANPINIIEANINNLSSSTYINVQGCDSGLPTSKSVTLNITQLDPNFNLFRLGILKTIKGVKTATYIDDITYNTTYKTYTYTGFQTEIITQVSDFLVDNNRYYGSNVIIQSDNRLLRANTKAIKIDAKYQKYANNINVDYYIEGENVFSMETNTDLSKLESVRSNWWKSAATNYSETKSLMRDEVYSLGIAFGLLKEGVETEVYHIPGRELNNIPHSTYYNQYNDSSTVSYSSTWDSSTVSENGESVAKWKVINTAASSIDGSINKLGYYESDIKYPDGYNYPITGSTNNGVSNTNIRHHKMPSSALEPIYKEIVTSGTINIVKRNLGLSFSNIEIPDELKGNIAYIRIYITPRNIQQNKSIIGKGIFVNCSYTKISDANNQNASDNYYIVPVEPYNDLSDELNYGTYQRSDTITVNPDANSNNNYYHSFYSPDTLLTTPALNADTVNIENEIVGTAYYYDTVASPININPAKGNKGHTNNTGYKRDLFYPANNGVLIPTKSSTSASKDVYNVNNAFKSTYKSIALLNRINKIHNAKSRRKIKKAAYVPFNSKLSTDQLGGMDNPYFSQYGSSNILVELNPSYSILGVTETTDTSTHFVDNNLSYNHLQDNANNADTVKGTFHFFPTQDPTVVYRYGSIKNNNSTQYGNIDGLNFIPTDLVIPTPQFDINNKLIGECKGLIGDTWIDIFSVKRVRYATKAGYTYGNLPEISVGYSSFFTESTLNHRLRYAEGVGTQVLYPQQATTTTIKEFLDYGFSKFIVDNDNYYKYNTDFATYSSKENYAPSIVDLETQAITDYGTRIVYSEKLINESISDTYRSFLANNYVDLTKNTGNITHLFNKEQELYAITRDSLWRLYATNQTIKSSTENIVVGTGQFLSNEPVQLLSIDGGFAGSSSKEGLVETPFGYFYIDRYKGKFILFNRSETDISLKDIYRFTESNYELEIINQIKTLDTEFDNPLNNYGYVVGFDSQLNRILITKLDYSFTSEQLANYKGIYNPLTSYSVGDIYLKDDKLYEFTSSTIEYTTIVDTSDLSDFTPSTVDKLSFSFDSSASHGTAIISPIDPTKALYTPTTDYTGSDSFDVNLNCNTHTVDINVVDFPFVPNYTFDIAEESSNGTSVGTVVGIYGSILTYEIESGDVFSIFSIDSSTGVITVSDNTNLVYNIVQYETLKVKVYNGSNIVYSTVVINVTRVTDNPTHSDDTVNILNTATPGSIIYTIPQAAYPHPEFPTSTLIYSVVSESVSGAFISNLDDPSNMTVTLASTTVLDPSTTPSYSIGYHVEDNLDSSRYCDFILTINVAYDTITCGTSEVFVTGEPNFPNITEVTLGASLGTNLFTFVSGDNPDRFVVKIGGVVRYDSGWIGNTSYQLELNNYLALKGLPSSTITTGTGGTATISKTTADTFALVEVYSLPSDTSWNFTLDCTVVPAYSYTRTQDFSKNDCTGGYTGSVVTYSQTYTSSVSTMDAEAIAMADSTFPTNGQAYANANGTCTAPLPPDAVGILVVDIYDTTTINATGFIATTGTIPYDLPAYPITNNFVPNDGTTAANCWILASDAITGGGSLKWRFEFNVARLINTYPSDLSFTFKISGRDISSGTINGAYSLKGADAGHMTMTGSAGSYIPSTSGATSIGFTTYSGKAVGAGADGTYGIGVGADILTFVYNNDPGSGGYKTMTLL